MQLVSKCYYSGSLLGLASLSPEQQRFAKAFRAMKLSSTLFGVVVIQIKPQLEKLLNLPYGSLIKEMALTQRLLDLFIQYQVPYLRFIYSLLHARFLATCYLTTVPETLGCSERLRWVGSISSILDSL